MGFLAFQSREGCWSSRETQPHQQTFLHLLQRECFWGALLPICKTLPLPVTGLLWQKAGCWQTACCQLPPFQTISTSCQAQEKQAPLPPPSSLGQNRAWLSETLQRQGHGTQQGTADPALVELLKSEREMEKKQLRCVPGFQSASCSLGGLHEAFHSRTWRVTRPMPQASKHSQKLHRTPTLLLLRLGASLA